MSKTILSSLLVLAATAGLAICKPLYQPPAEKTQFQIPNPPMKTSNRLHLPDLPSFYDMMDEEDKLWASNRHRRDAEIDDQGLAKFEDILAQARKSLDPAVLEGIDFSDPEQVSQLEELIRKAQAKNAKFNFAFSIQDEISDAYMERNEQRNGLSLQGSYSYSNGFVKTTVTYEADEKGFRVTNIETEPLSDDGPKPNKFGTALVQQVVSGVETKYAIQAQPVEGEDGVAGRTDEVGTPSDYSPIRLIDVTPEVLNTQLNEEIAFE